MKNFVLKRDLDISGVSGTGVVAQGVEFTNGKVCLCWLGDKSTIVVYDSIELVKSINCHGGHSQIIYLPQLSFDGEQVKVKVLPENIKIV